MRKDLDRHHSYKIVFMKIANDYIEEPTPKKSEALAKLVTDTLAKDPDLLVWFNKMFEWSNTPSGVHIDYKVKTPTIPS